ncbi:putative autophagy protein Atg27 [Triangularia verruculosa]|uniref:Autophagy-related protein 27 n=1 Tax=Triangularia verruculosa TaxID=2587418 RepID=A0AAN6XRT4_9PEZI|nr:putative autophagy protein Atg27 [Triangularia verruculosa]
MKSPRSWLPLLSSSMVVMITASPAPAAATFDCEKLPVDGHTYNFKDLAGPHTVVTSEFLAPSYHNTTYTLDLCGPLRQNGDAPKEERCPDGTRVCAIKHKWDPKTDKATVDHFIPIVVGRGDKQASFEWEAKRLPSEEPKDSKDKEKGGDEKKKKEGLKVTLKGGKYQGRQQQTVVEFRCSALKGDEEEWDAKKLVEYERVKREDKNEGDEFSTPERQLKKEGAALIWEGYKSDGEVDTLSLTWHTKLVCDKAVGDEPGKGKEPEDGKEGESSHWGFFTWFVVLVFLGIASYLIFGSWLNYNRYGARGWDLLPHGDTLRDVPYLLKDWTRRVLNTVQSSGSRGGYSAV